MRSRLEKTFERLKKDVNSAYILLCEGSVYRCPVPDKFWLRHLEDRGYAEEQQRVALEALHDRSLVEAVIEGNKYLLKQHNLLRSVALEHLNRLWQEDESSN